jgi:hypothetical protein
MFSFFKKIKENILQEKYIYRTDDIPFLKHMDEIAPALLKDYLRNHKDGASLNTNENTGCLLGANGGIYPLHNGNWKVKTLKYKHEWKEPTALIKEQYPTAWNLMETFGYDCPIAMYSYIKANSKIKLHFGADVNLDSKYMRFHIPLVVPSDDPKDIGIEIMGETIGWGSSFAFDNQGWHHVWNNTDQDRVIFLIDVHRVPCGIKPSQNQKWSYFLGLEAIRKAIGYWIRKRHFANKKS